MKTIRISYADKTERTADIAKTFDLSSEVKDGYYQDRDIISKFPECYAHFIDDVTVDMLVPDDFDVSQLGGTIVKSDGANPIHEFLGHEKTPMVIDKADTKEIPEKGGEEVKDEDGNVIKG